MRNIYLVNEIGTTYFFDYRSSALISSIGNIGVEKQNSYVSFKNRYKLVDSRSPQSSLDFEVVFLNGYEGYSKFLKFIRESKELRIFYNNGKDTKYCHVAFKSISKTELQSNTIQSTLSLDKLSLWLNKVNYKIEVNTDDNGKVFPFKYPHTYSLSFNGEVAVRNNGEIRAPLNIVIAGSVNNPRIDIMDGDVVLSTMRLLVQSADCIITVNADESDQYMTMKESGVERNIYQYQDFTCDNFLFVDRGEFTIKFSPGVSSETTCNIQMTEGYGGN
ncbi:MAG: hypothetical protein MJ238_04145 [Bacilli bacterium]|nr:hypothetical protein [Bacilli bacterium]